MRQSRGAVSIMMAFSLLFVMAATALSVDVGHVVYRDRRLESTIDLAAIDASRAIGDRRDPARNALEVAEEFARESATRNEFAYSDTDAGNSLAVELGIYEETTDTFTPFPALSLPEVYATANAVRVSGTTDVDYAFMPGASDLLTSTVVEVKPKSESGGTGGGTGGTTGGTGGGGGSDYLKATAAFSVGASLASFSSSDSFLDPILGGLLGSSVDLQAVDYDGLASAEITLETLWSELGLDAGSADSVLDTDVSLLDLVNATISILDDGDVANAAAAASLLTLRGSIDGSLAFTFGSILDLGVNQPGSAAEAAVSVLGLVGAAAETANGSHAVTIDLPVNVPGVASGTIALAFVEPPAIASGVAEQNADGSWVTRAHSAQTRMLITLNLASGITVGTRTVPLRVPVYIEGAAADGSLTGIDCSIINTDSVITVDASTDPLTAYIGEVNPDAMSNTDQPVTVSPATLASSAGVVTVTGYGQKSIAGRQATLTFDGPYDERVQQVGGAPINIDSFDTLNVTVSPLGLLTANVGTTVRARIASVLDALETSVLEPLSDLPLGIAIGGATVANPSADCIYEAIVD